MMIPGNDLENLVEIELSAAALEQPLPTEDDKNDVEEREHPYRWVWAVVPLVLVAIALAVALPLTLIDDNKEEQVPDVTPTSRPLPTHEWNCSEPAVDVSAFCETTVNGIAALHEDLGFPDHLEDFENFNPELLDGDFNVSTYFNVLNHTFLKTGHFLEYVYHFDGMGGYPILYVQDDTEPPFRTAQDYDEACNTDTPCLDYLDELVTADTPQGYMEYATLQVMGEQFYLYWHSAYNDHEIICNQAMLNNVFERFPYDEYGANSDHAGWMTEGEDPVELASAIDPTPTVDCIDMDVVSVRLLMFTKWGGIYRKTFMVQREPTGVEKLVVTEYESLIPFYIGYVYRV